MFCYDFTNSSDHIAACDNSAATTVNAMFETDMLVECSVIALIIDENI